MAAPSNIVTRFDCDNMLLDHDHVVAELRNHLEEEFGPRNRDRYFEIFQALHKQDTLSRRGSLLALVECDLSTLLGKSGSKS